MNEFNHLKSFVIFVGNNRSGTSVVGAFLNAHPNVSCCFEYNFLKKWTSYDWERNQYFSKMIHHAALYQHIYVPHNMSHDRLKVIGDKKSGETSKIMREWSERNSLEYELNSLYGFLDLPIKFIQLCRNPFDVVARKIIARTKRRKESTKIFKNCVNTYFQNHELAQDIENLSSSNGAFGFHRAYQEELILKPEKTLKALCDFLEVETCPDHIENCTSILFSEPRRTSRRRKWTGEEESLIYEKMSQHEDLKHYVL